MAKLTFLGAAGTVTGSRHLLEVDGARMLIDCGMFQGKKEYRMKNWEPFPVDPASIDKVLLTHAHIDHSGYLPRFVKEGFVGQVHCTHATRELVRILLKDSAHLQEEDARWANKKGFSKHKPALPLFDLDDAKLAMKRFKPVHYGDAVPCGENGRIKFRDAGHLLGSSLVDIRVKKNGRARKILFSGDLGRTSRPLLRDPVQVYNVDYLVLESTYGGRLHENEQPFEDLAGIINESRERGGVLLIPAFSVGRTQTILYVLRELEERGSIPEMPVFIDSPMAIESTTVFEKRIADLDLESRLLTIQGKNFIRPRHLHRCRTRVKSKQINDIKNNAIIISASGMAVGGRILHHLVHRMPNPNNTILLIGYQAQGTRGRSIQDGHPTIKIHGQKIPLKAKVETVTAFSGHADYEEILAWLLGFNRPPEKVFLVHGEPDSQRHMAQVIRQKFKWDTAIAEEGQTVELDI
ncbi:MAG: MBL fold metallo-hydrolase [candidate division Zixibacteria bacterium]